MHLVALVGVDGVGKTTQAKLLVEYLSMVGVPAMYGRNAGGRRWFGRCAGRLRRGDADALIGVPGMLAVEAVLRWAAIARALLLARLRGRVAVMDRYSYCQYVSIAVRGGWGERIVRRMFGVFPAPDLTLHLVAPPGTAFRRIEVRGTDHEELTYLTAVDAAYRRLPEAGGFVTVDASGDLDQVSRRVREAVEPVATRISRSAAGSASR